MSVQIAAVLRATTAVAIIVGALTGCAPMQPADPQLQFVNAFTQAKGLYERDLASYTVMMANPGASSRAQILEAYQSLLYQYSLAAASWTRVVYPPARQALPPELQPLSAPTATPSIAAVNQAYDHALEMNMTTWDINAAAGRGKPSKFPVPAYTGPFVIMAEAPPLPPLQDARDPQYARLVKMTKTVDAAQKADLNEQRAALAKLYGEIAELQAKNPSRYVPMPPVPQQQETQRWCMMGGGRVPC